jgi:integrase
MDVKPSEKIPKHSQTARHGHVWLGKRQASGIWYAQYKHPVSGKYVQRSLGTTIKKEALTIAAERSSQLTNRSLGQADGSAPLSLLFDEFFKARKPHLKKESQKKLLTAKRHLERWLDLEAPHVKKVGQITPAMARKLQRFRLSNDGVNKWTADNTITDLHTIFAWGQNEGTVGKNPFSYAKGANLQLNLSKKKREHHAANSVFTYVADEYVALVAEAKRRGWELIHDIIIVLASTGMRFGELANLVPEALVWGAEIPYIDIRARNDWSPKDPDEIKKVPMSPEVQTILKRRERESGGGYLFTNTVGNRVAENHSLVKFKKLFTAVGIVPERRLHWHSWRNYFVIRCLDANIAVHIIMLWTGHDSAKMVLHYARARMQETTGFAEFRKLDLGQM